jgi:hypothetical protein
MHSRAKCACARQLLFVLGFFIASCTALSPSAAIAQDIDVWIDPGHGGKDPGAPGFLADGVHNEKRLAFQVSSHSRAGSGRSATSL